jgi:RNA polymerase sigma factor (sigma-70 family)
MLKRPIGTMLNRLASMAFRQDLAMSNDAQLMDRCLASRDDTAFEEIVRRHGPMVLAVGRRLGLGKEDAEDAFQATFLVLARKLATIRPRGMVGNWLYGVAYRVALKARTVAARRWAKEKPMSKLPEAATVEKGLWDDLLPMLDRELSRLADKYRMPIVLCDLEGKTRKEAAQQLGWPEGTVAGRLAQARALLAKRLLKQGLPVSAGVLSALCSQNAPAAGVPATLVSTTLKAAGSYCARRAATAGTVSANAAALADSLLKGMLITKLKSVGLMTAVLFAMVCGGTMLIGGQTGDSDAAAKPPPALLAAPPGVIPKETPNDTRECQFPYGRHIFQVAFSPDGKLVVTDDQIWDAATGKKIRTLPLPSLKDRQSGTPFRLAFSPDSRHVAIHRYDDMVLVDVATGKEVWKVRLAPRQPYHSWRPGLSFTPDGKHIVTARNDEGVVRVFEASSGKESRTFAYDSNVGGLSGAVIESFGVSADSKRLVVHRYEAPDIAGMVLFDLETGKELARRRLSEGNEGNAVIRHSAPSPDGRHVFYAKKGSIHMMELNTGKEIRRFDSDGEHAYSVSCSPDERYVVAGVLEKLRKDDPRDQYVCWIQCWEIATGKTVRVIKGNKDIVGAPTVSPDGRLILATVNDTTARLWRLDKWAPDIAPKKPLPEPARPRGKVETQENKQEEIDLERMQGAWDSYQPDGKGVALLVQKKNKIPDEARSILEKAEKLEILSIHPRPPRDQTKPTIQGWEVLGSTTVKDVKEREKIVAAFKKAVADIRGDGTDYWRPQHALRARHDGKTAEFIICFRGNQVVVHVEGKEKQDFLIADSAEGLFNKVLADAKVPLPPKILPACVAVLIGALAANAGQIVLGLRAIDKLFLQECWHEGEPFYSIANLADEEITIAVKAPDGTRAGPWKIGARESRSCPVPIVKNPGERDFMKDGREIGLLRPPANEKLPKEKGYATNKNYNAGGDPSPLWAVQKKSTYQGGDVVEITFVVKAPNPKRKEREYNVTGFSLSRVDPKNFRPDFGQVILPAVEVTSETLTIEKDKEKFSVKVEDPKKEAEWHRVTARFAAPKMRTLKAGVVAGTWRGDGGGDRWLLRAIVLVPKAVKERKFVEPTPAMLEEASKAVRNTSTVIQGNQLPAAVKAILAKAEQFELLSLDPYSDRPDREKPKDAFHDWGILGKTLAKNKRDRDSIVSAVQKGISESDGKAAKCFRPRHGIRAVQDGKKVDLVICFECSIIEIYLDGKRANPVLTSGSPQVVLDRVLADAKVPLAPKGKK